MNKTTALAFFIILLMLFSACNNDAPLEPKNDSTNPISLKKDEGSWYIYAKWLYTASSPQGGVSPTSSRWSPSDDLYRYYIYDPTAYVPAGWYYGTEKIFEWRIYYNFPSGVSKFKSKNSENIYYPSINSGKVRRHGCDWNFIIPVDPNDDSFTPIFSLNKMYARMELIYLKYNAMGQEFKKWYTAADPSALKIGYSVTGEVENTIYGFGSGPFSINLGRSGLSVNDITLGLSACITVTNLYIDGTYLHGTVVYHN